MENTEIQIEKLKEEIKRCTNLKESYDDRNLPKQTILFAKTVIGIHIDNAKKAIVEGDIVRINETYQQLRAIK
ncbi:hypothetical protein [Flexithrix dorotheae]|uniref:hypothetical protein n=1 Tax=Flexithrix dorotheae TaxID=70993 RepID=UPI00036333F8|nr:hypothetical protein [Flexithrix dorotheae]